MVLYPGLIFATRAACRRPSNVEPKNASTISIAVPAPTTRAPIQSTLASLCWRDIRALKGSLHTTTRTAECRFAAMDIFALAALLMPMPPSDRVATLHAEEEMVVVTSWLLPVCPRCHVAALVQTEHPEGEAATGPAAAIRLNASMQATSFELRGS
jgi:hypothetical protein